MGSRLFLSGDFCPDTSLTSSVALILHYDINTNPPTDASLFAYRCGNTWKHMLEHEFLGFCITTWDKASLAHIHGHSFRIGGTVCELA